jgi:hypothetical protein
MVLPGQSAVGFAQLGIRGFLRQPEDSVMVHPAFPSLLRGVDTKLTPDVVGIPAPYWPTYTCSTEAHRGTQRHTEAHREAHRETQREGQ